LALAFSGLTTEFEPVSQIGFNCSAVMKIVKDRRVDLFKRDRVKMIYYVLTTLILTILYLIGWFIYRPSVAFESSDGKWGDHELLLKGRDFHEITYYFEKYKLRCNAPSVTLIRTTPKNLLNIFAWPSYLFDEKWKLKYREPSNSFQGGFYAKIWDCYNKPSGINNEEEWLNQARDEFFKNLASIKQPPLFSRP
jgi:hypothetical protein